jgi:formylglycine-generating enzyme
MKAWFWMAALPAALVMSSAHAAEALPAFEMVSVPAGCFDMGSPVHEKHERPVHKVCLKTFEIGKVEVTQAQWRAVMGTGPSQYNCGDDCPVERVSWNQVQEFIQKLNAQGRGGDRLPSEAEWEYACRSGGKEETWPGTSSADEVEGIAWYGKDAAGHQPHPVGTKKPNGLGIHDMAGNVWEWVQDKFVTPYPTEPGNNPVIEAGGEDKRVTRGGSFHGKVNYVRCGLRNRYKADLTDGRIGFRLARDNP